jgi:hypothetical protein
MPVGREPASCGDKSHGVCGLKVWRATLSATKALTAEASLRQNREPDCKSVFHRRAPAPAPTSL